MFSRVKRGTEADGPDAVPHKKPKDNHRTETQWGKLQVCAPVN